MCDDVHIDVCLSCGSYYGHTQSLENIWRTSRYKSRNETIMPQLCFKCMKREYGEEIQHG